MVEVILIPRLLILTFCILSQGPIFISAEFTYEEGEWETMIIDLISRQVSTLPIQDFVDDPQLLQKVDRVNKLTVYKKLPNDNVNKDIKSSHLNDQDETIIYRRKSVDLRVPVIVLRSHQDHLKVISRKRTFVLLRQNPMTNYTYFASYVYLRFWTDGQERCEETYLNEKICLEFDTWDNDRGEIKTKDKYFGWTDCASSFLFSCRFEAPPDENAGNNSSSVGLVERGYRNTTLNYPGENETKMIFTPAENLPFDDTIDIFWDLETNAGEGHYIRETIRHSSLFKKPESFMDKAGISVSGRSLGTGPSNLKSVKDQLKEMKEKAGLESAFNKKKKSALYSTLTSRNLYFQKKNSLNTLIREYAKHLGYSEFYKIKNDPKKMEILRSYRNASEILLQLELLGDEYKEGQHLPIQEGDTPPEGDDFQQHVTMLMKADEQPDEESLMGSDEKDQSLTSAFGKALSGMTLKSGGGMSGRSLTELDSKVAETIAKSVLFSSTDVFQIPGWKLQEFGSSWKLNDSLIHESKIFYGLGTCPSPKDPVVLPTKGDDVGTLVDFYLSIWRTYCLKESREYFLYLIEDKYLKIENNKFIIPTNLTQSMKRKLRRNEFRKLSAALEVSSFTQNYPEELKHSWNEFTGNGGKEVSRSVHFLTEFGFLFIRQARGLADEHFLKLCRNLVLTFKGVFTKLLQDYEILLTKCEEPDSPVGQKDNQKKGSSCDFDFLLNYNDRLEVHSFMEFVQRGLAPIEQNGKIFIDQVFRDFVGRNALTLENTLTFYQ